MRILIGALLPWVLLACASNSTTREQDEQVGKTEAAIVGCDSGPVLDFETTSNWSGSGASISSSTRRVQGARSLKVTGSGSSFTISSQSTCVPAEAIGQLSLYVSLAAPNPSLDALTLSVRVSSASRALSNALIGTKRVSGLGKGLFQRVELPVPSAVGTALALGASDLKVKVEITGAAASQYLFDAIAFQRGPSAPVTTALDTESRSVTIDYLPPIGVLDTALAASNGLVLSDQSSIQRSPSGYGAVVSTGGPATQIGVEAHVGDVASVPAVTMADRSFVHGRVLSNGSLSRGNSTTVSGTIQTGAGLGAKTLSWNVEFGLSSTAVLLEPDTTLALSPGAFGAVTVKPRASLALSTGTYYFKSLDLQADSQFNLDSSKGPIILYVRDQLTLRGKLTYKGTIGDLLLTYFGTGAVDLDTSFNGVLVAPSANVRFGVGGAAHGGSAFAKLVRVDPRAKFTQTPAFPLVGLLPKEQCSDALVKSAWGQAADNVSFQKAIQRYCGGSDAGPCESTLLARVNVDYYTAASQLLQKSMGTPQHMALLLDRERKVRLFHGNEALSCAIANGDADGDFVPSPQDACPSTPPLTPTLENGCTDSQLPLAPDIDDVLAAIPNLAIPGDPACLSAPLPVLPSPFGAWRSPADPTRGKALWISKDPNPSSCPTWYELEGKLTDGTLRNIVFTADEDVTLSWLQKPANTLQFNIHDTDGNGRGAWARYDVWTVEYRARVFNASGRRSAWSNWFKPGQDGCAAGACSDF